MFIMIIQVFIIIIIRTSILEQIGSTFHAVYPDRPFLGFFFYFYQFLRQLFILYKGNWEKKTA